MDESKLEDYPKVSERNWLERIYYYHGLFCANHPAFIIILCGVLIISCSAPILTYSPLTAKTPSEWNETLSVNGSNNEKPDWLKEKPAAYIQQIVVAVLIEEVNTSILLHNLHGAFESVFTVLSDLNEHKHTVRSGKRIKISDLCFLIHQHNLFLGEEEKILPEKGCLQISPANLWKDFDSFQKDKNILSKVYGKPSKNTLNLKENIFGIPLRATGFFPLNGSDECMILRYAVTTVLRNYSASFTISLKNVLQEKFPPVYKTESVSDTIVHIHYKGDNVIEIYHLCFTYFMVFIYLIFSVSKIEMVKSKFGLAISAVITVVASLSMAAGLCIFFGMVPSVSSSEIFPYLVIIIGLENVLVITRSIVSTHPCLPVPIRVAEGLSREGRSITLNLATELLFLICGYCTFVPAVQEFCMVGGVGILTDLFLQIVFFATVLSIDLSRLEPPTKSPHVEIDVCNSIPPVQTAFQDTTFKQSTTKQTEPQQSTNWSDVLTYLYNPMKIFSLRQDLPKRLNFAYFWARTRIVQRGIMVFAIMYLAYITSITVLNKEDVPANHAKDKYKNSSHPVSVAADISVSQESVSYYDNLGKRSELKNYSSTLVAEEHLIEPDRYPSCIDGFHTEGLWRNLSRQHWPELLDLYGVNVMDRYISVLPPINLQYKIGHSQLLDTSIHDGESMSKLYQDISKNLKWTSRSYALELAGFVRVMYLITGIFIIVTVYLIYQLLSAKKPKPTPKSVVLITSSMFLEGHRQNIECVECNGNVIVSSCLEGALRVWDCNTTECISVIQRESRPSQIWSLHCWDKFVVIGCSNGDVEIWDFFEKSLCFLYESDSCGVTAIRYISESNVLVISRLNGFLEFVEFRGQFSRGSEILENHVPSMRKKTQSGTSTWKTVVNSVSSDTFPCHACRAHRKTISVLETCKDLVISGSYDNLLKVFRANTGVCLFTLRGHTSPVTALATKWDMGAISGSDDGEMRLWSLISGESNSFAHQHSTSIVRIVCTDSRIASLDITELLCIWDRFTRRCLQRITQLPGGCLSLTSLSNNTVVCVGRDTLGIVELTRGQILRSVILERKHDHILINHALKCDDNTVVCDYGERLVLLTFHTSVDKNS